MADGSQMSPQDLQRVNMQARALILGTAVYMRQQIFSNTVNPATAPIVQVNPRNVGLISGFLVEISGNISNTGMTTDLTRTGLGTYNILQNVIFSDLNNQQRINTSGRHLGMLNCARQGFGFLGAYAPNLPNGIGNNWSVQTGPSTIAAGANADVRVMYWVPLSYAADDLRGSLYANVVNATMNLQLTINNAVASAAGDPVSLVYRGNTGGWNGNVTVTVYQYYYDQLPRSPSGPILPPLDLNAFYELKETNVSGMVANTDFPYGYSNFRDFLSTFYYYDMNGTPASGSDVNYFSLVSANFTQIFKLAPEVCAAEARPILMADPPPSYYYFDFRRRPINTQMFGNMELNLNAKTATNPSSAYVGTEAFGNLTTIAGASSLSAG